MGCGKIEALHNESLIDEICEQIIVRLFQLCGKIVEIWFCVENRYIACSEFFDKCRHTIQGNGACGAKWRNSDDPFLLTHAKSALVGSAEIVPPFIPL